MAMSSATMARAHGIEVVYQDLALADQQTVYMNMFLGRELVNRLRRCSTARRMIAETEKLVQRARRAHPVGACDDPRPLRRPAPGRRDRPRHALGSKLILLDEPTAALGVAETAKVEEIVRVAEGARHRRADRSATASTRCSGLSDRICVLRRGKQIGVRETAETDKNEIVAMITGLREQERRG